jgi:hypothetical protein
MAFEVEIIPSPDVPFDYIRIKFISLITPAAMVPL